MPRISDLLTRIVSEHASTSFTADKIGGFTNLKRPRVIWIGPTEPVEQASKIARAVELGVRELRFEKEKRAFKPHLTLGRVRERQSIGRLADRIENYSLNPIVINLDRLVLFKSTLTPSGPIYEKLSEVELKASTFSG